MNLTVKEIAVAVGGKIIGCDNPYTIKNIVTDSRKADANSLFVAIKGDNFDGHSFISNVAEKGCKAAIVSSLDSENKNVTFIKVEDTKKALGDIARYYIAKKDITKIAVTGSVGKTTTKEMLASVCGNINKTLKTEGNFNNDIGLPLTAYRLEDEETAIFEMGMNHFGEIDYLSDIVKPDIAVITNIGYSHVENLGSREGILKAKLEVVNHMNKDGILVLNGDDDLLYSIKDSIDIKKIYIGINNKNCDLVAENIKEENNATTFKSGGEEYKILTLGIHNVYNALTAIAVGKLICDDEEKIKEGLLNFKTGGIRQNIIECRGYTVIADCYNASPDSMIASMDVLSKVKSKRKIAVLGSVAELGEKRDELLYEVGSKIKNYNIDELINNIVENNKLVKINDNLYLTNNQLDILKRYNIDYYTANSIRDLMIKIEDIIDYEDIEELEILLESLNERQYYENTNK